MSSTQKMETDEKLENPVTLGTSDNPCHALCRTCNSSHLKAINDLKKAGHTLDNIVNIVRDKLNFNISKSSLSRHFANQNKRKNILAAQIINNDLIEEATKQAVHTKKIVELIDKAFSMISARIDAGWRLDIGDLEKLMKLRYQVMNGQDADESDIMAIFQKATDKYGVDLQQGVLFKPIRGQQAGGADIPQAA